MRTPRLSVPGCGRSLAAVTEQRAKYIRKAVEILKPFMTSDEARKVFLKLLGVCPSNDCTAFNGMV